MKLHCAISLALLAIAGCSRPPTLDSPDGKLTLRTSVEESHADPTRYGCVILEISDSDGNLLHRENTAASAFQQWDVGWIGNDRIRLDSADRGAYYWTRQPDGSWQKEAQ